MLTVSKALFVMSILSIVKKTVHSRIDFSFSDPCEVLLWGWQESGLWNLGPSGEDGEQGNWDSQESLFVYREDRGSDRGRLRAAWRGRHTVVTVRGFSVCSCKEVLMPLWHSSSPSPAEVWEFKVNIVSCSSSVLLQPFCMSFSSFSVCLKPFRVRGCAVHRESGLTVGLREPRPFSLGVTGGWSSIKDNVSCWHTAICLWWREWRRRLSSWGSLRAWDSPEPGIHMLGLSPRQRKAWRWGWKSGNGENPYPGSMAEQTHGSCKRREGTELFNMLN